MMEYQLTAMETKFADVLWDSVPIVSPSLVKLCEEKLNWKKSTTYTVLRKLEQKGIFFNDGGTVVAVISKTDFYALQSKNYVEETFSGSLPKFVAAFIGKSKLTSDEIYEIEQMIYKYRQEDKNA